jgi:hypothetical protein
VADAAHFAAFGVNLATQQGCYPHAGNYIQFFKELRALARSFGPDKAILTSDCGLSGFVLWADAEVGDLGCPEPTLPARGFGSFYDLNVSAAESALVSLQWLLRKFDGVCWTLRRNNS